jgi:Fe2+ or Zn2+ uptake regulation protein
MKQTAISFHNTTDLQGSELQEATSKALTQDEEVLRLFKVFDKLTLTPERIHKHLQDTQPKKNRNVPLTSIRRAFSNLKKRGLIDKTDAMVRGNYGMKVNSWKLVD